ncbi:MAG: baseplate J/gp47 family protein [Selenomonas ruminantium]|uniref:Baseplate J/gp47 family protein n=1 Tax=Selenomonas ruminantium TaxID=971 RepID=A0A927WNQ7_SELRU|nr:baseplate J/gp47 family protein [Selenomonas ruminantium]
MKLSDIPDVNFVDLNAEEIEAEVFTLYTTITGRSVEKGDPIRLFILFIVDLIIRLLNKINDTGRQNLIKHSTGTCLDGLAANAWITRIGASPATVTIKAVLSTVRERETVIPAGTRVSPGNNIYFATDKDLVIAAGETEGIVAATCTEIGTVGNDYVIGEINTIVDPVPYVTEMTNITKSEGGAEVEEDDALRQRVWEAPESLSVAGPAGAYRAKAMAVNSAIADVYPYSPSAGVVRNVVMLKNGGIPGAEILADVLAALNADTERPLTDFVEVVAPEVVNYDINAKYYILPDASAVTVQAKVAAAVNDYITWQYGSLGRDITPDKLQSLIYAIPGIKRVIIESPVHTVLHEIEIAKPVNISVTMAGSEDE